MLEEKKEKIVVGILLILVIGLIIALIIAMTPSRPSFEEPTAPPPPYGEPMGCTMDAKICDDGSSVGRSGPNCEFAPCPGEDGEIPIGSVPTTPSTDDLIGGGMGVCTMEAKMCPDGETFVSRTGPTCEFELCPSEGDVTTNSHPGASATPDGNDVVCAEIYAPVCASVDVQCIKAPCPAMEQTFSNECEANRVAADILYEGKCE